jgi:predicted acylesterase/phospholipase RssA
LFGLLVAGVAASCSCGVGCLSIKNAYVQSSYPTPDGKVVERKWELTIASSLVPALVVGYQSPRKVGACLEKIGQSPQWIEHLLRFGKCLSRGSSGLGHWGKCMDTHFPWIKVSPPPAGGSGLRCEPAFGCGVGLSHADQLNLANSLAAVGSFLYAYRLLVFGRSKRLADFDRIYKQAIRASLANAILLLKSDPHPAARHASVPRDTLPALALSGGGPNGSFTAGVLQAMLSLREAALASPDIPEAQKKIIREKYRFGSVVGTSVGSLISTALDLYFTRQPALLSPALKKALKSCLHGSASLGPRAFQQCALRKLFDDFQASEWDYLCVEKGSILGVFGGSTKNMLRFTPLRRSLLDPFMKAFGERILNNNFLRVSMAFGLEQNLLMSLDERACRGLGQHKHACLISGLMASISEPGQINAVGRVYSGLRPNGETGKWYDGGLRSALPAYRAAALTYNRVLAISTGRLLGVPSKYGNGFSIVLGSATAAIAQNGLLELSQAQLYQKERANRRGWLDRCMRRGAKPGRSIPPLHRPSSYAAWCPPGRLGSLFSTTSSKASGVLPFFVPDDIKPSQLYASGYTFDPYVMKGLFLWGQKSFLRRRSDLYRWLGWEGLHLLEARCRRAPTRRRKPTSSPASGSAAWSCSPAFQKAVQQLVKKVTKTLHTEYIKPQPPHDLNWWKAHARKRRKLLESKITTCQN